MTPREQQKRLEIIGGPNGAGKTSFAESLLRRRRSLHYVNADIIAKGLNAGGEEIAAVEAGRVMLRWIDENLELGRSFAFESTLAGKGWVRLIERSKSLGFIVTIYFLLLRSEEQALERVRYRVAHGGHAIPEEVVRRRFHRSREHFFNLYQHLADRWLLFDNSGDSTVLIARKDNKSVEIVDPDRYSYYSNNV